MNKIIEVALKGRFGTDDLTNLMEVITATPNPEMATEILLGVYVRPEIPNVVVTDQGLEKTVVSVDYWTNYVTYSYKEEVRKQFYIDKDTDTSLITLDNYKDYEKRYDDDNIRSFYLPTGEIKQRQSSCSFSDWLSQERLAV
jgi:hypothetical protein